MLIDFEMPPGMTREDIARTFAAYLLGPLAFENEERTRGPFQKQSGSDESWQLDETNDFFLLFLTDGRARIGSRYDSQEAQLKALLGLFQLRFPVERRGKTQFA
jgi:hypothetical protein